MSLDKNDPQFVELIEKAGKFYDVEHDLTVKERTALANYFSTKVTAFTTTMSLSFAAGVAFPFIINSRKKKITNPGAPILFGILFAGAVPGLITPYFYRKMKRDFAEAHGSSSRVVRVIDLAPDDSAGALFWAGYFKKTSTDLNARFNDPRTVENPRDLFKYNIEQNSTPPLDATDRYYDRRRRTRPSTIEQQEQLQQEQHETKDIYNDSYVRNGNVKYPAMERDRTSGSAWDKVRHNEDPLHMKWKKDEEEKRKEAQQTWGIPSSSGYTEPTFSADGDPFDDGYSSTESSELTSSTSAWDKIRKQEK